jgi:hypothetical protein
MELIVFHRQMRDIRFVLVQGVKANKVPRNKIKISDQPQVNRRQWFANLRELHYNYLWRKFIFVRRRCDCPRTQSAGRKAASVLELTALSFGHCNRWQSFCIKTAAPVTLRQNF